MNSLTLDESPRVSAVENARTSDLQGHWPRGHNAALWGFVTMFAGVAIGVLGKKLLHQDIVTVVGVLIALLGMFLTALPYVSPLRSQKHVTDQDSQPEGLTPSQPSEHLPPVGEVEFVPSITERTTSLLQNPVPTPAKYKEAGTGRGNAEDGQN